MTAGSAGSATPVAPLQDTLAAEHAAVFVYGVLGGRVQATEDPGLAERLRSAYDAHRGRRDALRAAVAGTGEVPVAAAPAYRVGVRSRDPVALAGEARQVEERCAATYAALVASTVDDDRREAVGWLTDAAVRALGFGAEPTPYPGVPELGDGAPTTP